MMIAANYLTDIRTAAASAIATKLLARDDTKTLAIFGTGRQARAHARLLPLVRGFEKIYLCGHDPRKTQALAKQLAEELSTSVEPNTPEVCATADVICTCTNSRTPLFDGNLLKPGSHLNLVGTFQPDAREVDATTIARSRVIVDTYAGAFAEAGDILMAIEEGAVSRDHVVADLHELVTRNKVARTHPSDITLFKSVGCALEDLAAAELIQKKLTTQVR
jgi:ornithine cyclodeaminase